MSSTMKRTSNRGKKARGGKRPGKGRGGARTGNRYGFGPEQGRGGAEGAMRATNSTTGMTVRNMPLFGYRTRRTVPYYASGSFTTGASVAGTYVFSANGIFDPDITGTGGQPMGFDQMMIFYNHYTVVRSRIRLEVANLTTNVLTNAGIAVRGSSTPTTVIEQLIETGDIAFVHLTYTGQAQSIGRLTRSVNAGQFQGINSVMDDPNMRGDSASNPTEQLYFHVSCWNPYSATVGTIGFEAVIEYDVVFHEPRVGSLSVELAHAMSQKIACSHDPNRPCTCAFAAALASKSSPPAPVEQKTVPIELETVNEPPLAKGTTWTSNGLTFVIV